jgi:hypothetical protein
MVVTRHNHSKGILNPKVWVLPQAKNQESLAIIGVAVEVVAVIEIAITRGGMPNGFSHLVNGVIVPR